MKNITLCIELDKNEVTVTVKQNGIVYVTSDSLFELQHEDEAYKIITFSRIEKLPKHL